MIFFVPYSQFISFIGIFFTSAACISLNNWGSATLILQKMLNYTGRLGVNKNSKDAQKKSGISKSNKMIDYVQKSLENHLEIVIDSIQLLKHIFDVFLT